MTKKRKEATGKALPKIISDKKMEQLCAERGRSKQDALVFLKGLVQYWEKGKPLPLATANELGEILTVVISKIESDENQLAKQELFEGFCEPDKKRKTRKETLEQTIERVIMNPFYNDAQSVRSLHRRLAKDEGDTRTRQGLNGALSSLIEKKETELRAIYPGWFEVPRFKELASNKLEYLHALINYTRIAKGAEQRKKKQILVSQFRHPVAQNIIDHLLDIFGEAEPFIVQSIVNYVFADGIPNEITQRHESKFQKVIATFEFLQKNLPGEITIRLNDDLKRYVSCFCMQKDVNTNNFIQVTKDEVEALLLNMLSIPNSDVC